MSPIERLIDQNVRCILCNLKPPECPCWASCWCGERYLKTEAASHSGGEYHRKAVDKVKSTFPVGLQVENVCGVRAPEKAMVMGYSRFPYDNWLRLKYDGLKNVVREPSEYFAVEGAFDVH